MPFLIFGVPLVLATGSILISTLSNEAEDTVTNTGVNLIVIAAGALGLWASYKVLQRAKF